MPISVDESMLKSAFEVISENASEMKSKENPEKPDTIMYRYAPRYEVTQANYMKFLKNNGIDPQFVDKLTKAEQAWNAGCAQYAKEHLEKIVPNALKDSKFMQSAGAKSIKATVFTSVKDGKRGVTVNAYQENRNPRATSEADAITKSYGSITLRHTITKDFSPEFAESVSTDVEKMIKGKF